MKTQTGDRLSSAVVWKFLERSSVQILNLVLQIVLARLIAPAQFGNLAIILVFFNIADIFVQRGFGSSIVRAKDVSEEDINSVLFVSSIISILLIIVINVCAPFIGDFYDSTSIVNPLRLLSLNLIASPLYCVLNALYIKQMRFKGLFVRGFISTFIAGVVGIWMAFLGLGIWALVSQILVHQFLLVAGMLIGSKVRFSFKISKDAFSRIFSFGKNVLATELLFTLVENLRTLLIGKKYTESDLAYYDRGQVYPSTLMRALYDTLFSILLPHFSKYQDDNERLKKECISSTYIAMIFITPIFLGLASVSEEVIVFLLTDLWIAAVPYMVIFCIYQSIFPYHIVSKAFFYSIGKSRTVLNIEIFSSLLSLALMIISISFGIMWIAISLIVVRLVSAILYICFMSKSIGSMKSLTITWKPLLAGSVMFAVVYFIEFNIQNVGIELLLNILVGIVVYIFSMFVLDRKLFVNLREMLKLRALNRK